jgi:hypothetical protein
MGPEDWPGLQLPFISFSIIDFMGLSALLEKFYGIMNQFL